MPETTEQRDAPEVDLSEDPLQFIWAVSYADLLMVLLTFFIIFFEFTTSVHGSSVDRIVVALAKDGSLTDLRGKSGSQAPSPTGPAFDTVERLAPRLAALGAKATPERRSRGLVILLADNVYAPARFTVDSAMGADLTRILDLLRPFAKEISLTFIGHTDESPIARIGGTVVDSNIVLSNLRAAKAVEFAISHGWDPAWVAAQGAAQYVRNSRSLSLQILERSER